VSESKPDNSASEAEAFYAHFRTTMQKAAIDLGIDPALIDIAPRGATLEATAQPRPLIELPGRSWPPDVEALVYGVKSEAASDA